MYLFSNLIYKDLCTVRVCIGVTRRVMSAIVRTKARYTLPVSMGRVQKYGPLNTGVIFDTRVHGRGNGP